MLFWKRLTEGITTEQQIRLEGLLVVPENEVVKKEHYDTVYLLMCNTAYLLTILEI